MIRKKLFCVHKHDDEFFYKFLRDNSFHAPERYTVIEKTSKGYKIYLDVVSKAHFFIFKFSVTLKSFNVRCAWSSEVNDKFYFYSNEPIYFDYKENQC